MSRLCSPCDNDRILERRGSYSFGKLGWDIRIEPTGKRRYLLRAKNSISPKTTTGIKAIMM
jgi:hypothetical protein